MSANAPTLLAVQQRESSSLRADFSWVFAGNAVYAAGQWVTLILLAKLTTPELVGQYTLGLAIAVPVFMLASLQLRWALVSEVSERTHFGHYLSLRLLSTAFGLLVILATTQALGFHGPLRWVILFVGVTQAIETISDIYYARLQLHDRMDRISKSLIVRTVLSAFGLTVGIGSTGNLLWGVVGIGLARAMVLFGYDMRRRSHDLGSPSDWLAGNEALRPRWNPMVQRQLLWLSLPLGIVGVLASLNSNIPRYFIQHALGERALGIFSALAFLFAAGSYAVVSLGQSAFTRLARSYATGNLAVFRLLLGKLLICGVALGVCGIIVAKVLGQEILTILFRPEYAEQADLLPWLMAIGCVGYMAQFLGFGMTAARYYYPQIVLFVLTNLSVAVASYVLVARHGLLGAILAMLISVIVQLVGSFVILMIGMRRRACVCTQNVGVA